MSASDVDVLVAGAGPTGLLLALLLVKMGVRVRVVDEAAEAGTTSRALAVQARTLEFYRQIDLADEVVRRGRILGAVNLWRRGERVAHIELGTIGRGESPFPFGVIFPQDEHERLLVERLEGAGVRVERSTALASFEATDDRVVAHVRAPDGCITTCTAKYLAGCDGARSTTRRAIGAQFPGGTYEHLFYVADIEARGPTVNGELHVLLDDSGFLGVFPLAGEGRARLVGTIRDDAAGGTPSWADVDRRPIERIGIDVAKVHWFSTYRVHHRVADRFRRGRVFLLGDAAHIHSPVGGQGMNTGLGDAMNLAWKIAAVAGGRASDDLLDTYEPERIKFARRLVATTDQAFQAASSQGRLAEVMRTHVVPRIAARVAETRLGRRVFFRVLSQTAIEYRASAWSVGRAGSVHGGDRLPWVDPGRAGAPDNFAPLRSLDWQVHVYGTPASQLRAACETLRLPLHTFAQGPATKEAGLVDGAAYLVRPDGYIGGVFEGNSEQTALAAYAGQHRIRVR
jgi:2-polyprenyl-6-methoxyphenol hydroxylase-like FAD-dependent oxidoreductase